MSYVKALPEYEVRPGSAVCVELEGHVIALVRSTDGRLFAVDDTCSHEEASLSEGFVEDGIIECPRHGATFDLETGKALTLPAIKSIGAYQVKVENGEILVNIT